MLPQLAKYTCNGQSCQISYFWWHDLWLPASLQTIQDLDVELFLIKHLSKSYHVIDHVSEPLLQICNGLSLLDSEQLIFLNQCMLPCTLDISCSFMIYFKNVLHFFCRSTLRISKNMIKIQGTSYNILGHTVILSFLALSTTQFIPHFFYSLTTHNTHVSNST